MKRANTMSTITVELTIKVKTKFTSSNAENTKWIHLTTDVKFSQTWMFVTVHRTERTANLSLLTRL